MGTLTPVPCELRGHAGNRTPRRRRTRLLSPAFSATIKLLGSNYGAKRNTTESNLQLFCVIQLNSIKQRHLQSVMGTER
jgi:hypothetical protein